MNKDFEKAKQFIADHSNFLLASHARTDGDDCGSMLAMTHVLLGMGKKATPTAVGGVPPSLKFLPNHGLLKDPVPEDNYDAIILFGCSNKERTDSEYIANSKLPTLNIDHHPDNKMYADVNLVDPTKSSVAEFVFDFIKYLKVPINQDIAKCLLTGIFTDTGSFMYSNTQPSTLAAAAELMKHGARIDKIHNFTYKNKDMNVLKAWGKAFANIQMDEDNRVAISVLTEEDMKEIGPISDDTFTGFTEVMNTIPGIRFAMFVKQEGEYIKGSVRSEEDRNVDVSAIAKTLGGGGHKLASGFRIKGKLVREKDGSWKVLEH